MDVCKSACLTYLKGKSRKPHRLRNDLKQGLGNLREGGGGVRVAGNASNSGSNDVGECSAISGTQKRTGWSPCTTCDPVLTQLKPHFDSLVRQGLDLRKRKRILPTPQKPDSLHYRNLVDQNRWVRCNLFDALGNYKYCQRCITSILGIGTQRLAHQRKVKQRQAHAPLVHMTKAEVAVDHLEEFVVLPDHQEFFKGWWDSIGNAEMVQVRFPHESHGLARKISNFAKTSVLHDFLKFVDENSQPNGRQSGSFGAHFYFNPKFSRIGEPKKSERNVDEKRKHSLLCEFNRAQCEAGKEVCSERSAFRWLKQHRPKHGICPHLTDYCDTCKELVEEMNRQRTILQQLRHSGDSSIETLQKHEELQKKAESELSDHKKVAQEALEHYKFVTGKCKRDWQAIVSLASRENLDELGESQLQRLKESFVLVLSADYQMTKVIPFWGSSAQPGMTYYQHKVSHDLFGIVDHRDDSNYVSVFDERVGPKNTDHTVSLLSYYLFHSGLVPEWVKCVCIFLDNATSTNKNRYRIGWAIELVQQSRLDHVRLPFMVVGHTKFAPDRLFSRISNSYNSSDVFNIGEIVAIAEQYATATEEDGMRILKWRQELDKKYTELDGIRKYHDFVISQNGNGKVVLKLKASCASGTLKTATLKLKSGCNPEKSCFPDSLLNYHASQREVNPEKMHDLLTMYSRFIDPSRWPTYLESIQPNRQRRKRNIASVPTSDHESVEPTRKKHCSVPGCNGTGHKNIERGHTTRAGCPIYHNVQLS